MKLFLYLIISLGLTLSTKAQIKKNRSYKISGYVFYDSCSKAFDGMVAINNYRFSTSIDQNGYYELYLPHKFYFKDFEIVAIANGYRKTMIMILNSKLEITRKIDLHLTSIPPFKDKIVITCCPGNQ